MKSCTVVCGYKPNIKEIIGDVIGVDKGCLYLIEKGINIKLALGDFDSVNEQQYGLIKTKSENLIKLDPVKDDTDLEHCLKYLETNRYRNVNIYGALGGRLDHEMINIKLCYLSKMNIKLIDDSQIIYKLEKGIHYIQKNNYQYLSLICFDKALINLTGVKYPISYKEIDFDDLYTTSNEINEQSAKLEVLSGRVLVIQCRD